MRASWLPKLSNGWFFRAESFFSVLRYLDVSALDGMASPPDFLSHSHGEGFLRFFEERLRNQALYILDEPESALSPARQIEFVKLLRAASARSAFQLVIATHSPLLMAYPGATLLSLTARGLEPVKLEETEHFRLLRDFCAQPRRFFADPESESH
jgi:predicted ATPase